MSGWTSAELRERFLTYLGRGVGGVMDADELWTDARVYLWLSDAQEQVFADMAPIAPHAFVGAPVQLTTTDGGQTYTFGSTVYPFGHVEVYAQETGGRLLYATTYGNSAGDFVIEGATIRTPGNRTRSYQTGPWARFTQFPARLSSTVQPTLTPPPARELVLWKALEMAAEVSNGSMDPTPWAQKFAEARRRWTVVWQTQYQNAGQQALTLPNGPWWLNLDSFNQTGV